ncbi:hypothetical protein [Cupriavidus sp. BIC8F]|uniref:hypothetical protein n=1 Tax=Cupriavidus sp. BIC8F TaxID=3079014 RepID=UPI0029163563|nr:hypothetical protein [Cupriavidus sp. BIC8F]
MQVSLAREAGRGLVEGNGQLADFAVTQRSTVRIDAAAIAYGVKLERMAAAIRQRLANPRSTTQLELRMHYRAVEQAASEVESILFREIAARRSALHRLDALNIALVGLLTLVLFALLARSERRRAGALEELSERESQLRAFVSAMPGVSFLLDAEGGILKYLAARPSYFFSQPLRSCNAKSRISCRQTPPTAASVSSGERSLADAPRHTNTG